MPALAAHELRTPAGVVSGGGHGLALLLARAIVELHGGAIESRRGAEPARDGTIVRMPRAEAP